MRSCAFLVLLAWGLCRAGSVAADEGPADIAFWRDHHIWVASLAGGQPRQLDYHVPARGEGELALGPDGRSVAFVDEGMVAVLDTTVANARPKRIATGRNPRWSPDGKVIVFERQKEIAIIAADGTGGKVIGGAGCEHPGFGHDGNYVVCADASKVREIALDGKVISERAVTVLTGDDVSLDVRVTVSADGGVMLVDCRGGLVMVYDRKNRAAEAVSMKGVTAIHVAWHASGKFYVFEAARGTSRELSDVFRVDLDGEAPRLIFQNAAFPSLR